MGFASLAFPPQYWRKVWSTNPLARVNTAVKRPSDVMGIVPNEAAVVVGAVVSEQHDEWQAGRRSGSAESLAPLLIPATADPDIALPLAG